MKIASIHILSQLCCILLCLQSHLFYAQERAMQSYDLNFNSFTPLPQPYQADELFLLSNPSSVAHPEFGINPFNTSCSDCFEIIDKRTIDSRYYVKKGTGGSIFYAQKAYGPLHYQNEKGNWSTIDHRLQPSEGEQIFTAPNQPVPVTINLAEAWSSIQLISGDAFTFNQSTRLLWSDGITDQVLQDQFIPGHRSSAGHDGVVDYDIWPGIDRQQVVQRGEIKTNYILQKAPNLPASKGWMIIEDRLSVPPGMSLNKSASGILSDDGFWYGSLELTDQQGKKYAEIEKPIVYESGPSHSQHPVSWYKLIKDQDGYRLRILVSASWLMSPNRQYPITIDPLVIGLNTYNVGYMGFPFDATCFDTTNYCAYQLTVTVPGKSTLTDAMFDARYVSKNGGCGLFNNCIKKEAAFKIIGPCGQSPNNTGVWTCTTLPQANLAGTCYGDSLPMFQTISCLPPQCPDHVINFEMRTFHCSCPLPVCDTVCHVMRPGTWTITIEARTLEGKVTGSTTFCQGNTATLVANGYFGVPPYTYYWLPGGMTTQSVSVTPNTTTTYTVRITDTCGIWLDTSATVTILPLPNISFTTTDVFCPGGSNGSATATGSGGPPPYSYSWNTNPPQNTATASGLTSGYHQVTVTDGLGCKSVDSVFVGITNVFGISGVATDVTCKDFNDGIADVSVVVGQIPYTYAWSNGASTEDLNGLGPGNYIVTVTDGNGCADTLHFTINEPDSILVDAGTGKTIFPGDNVTLNGSFTPSGNYIINWQPTTGLSDPSVLNPVASPSVTTTYTLTVTSDINAACYATDTVTIKVYVVAGIAIPNAFSPNNDGTNDLFFQVPDVEIVSLQVFNRWGVTVFEGSGPWDGKHNGYPQPVGTYAYRAVVRLVDSPNEVYKKGNVTLLR